MLDREQRCLDAIEDFRRARRRALLEDLLAWVRGEPDDLLRFEEVWERVGEDGPVVHGLSEIPLEAIVGSVGRYGDFTRHFLPRRPANEPRWVGVRAAMSEGRRLPPIEVYELGGLYFVKDGNHRVSVARELGLSHLPALVTTIPTRVTLSPDLGPDGLIIASEYAAFLGQTNLDEQRPELQLQVTAPGAYKILAGHIEQQRRLAARRGAALSLPEAAARWYETVYLPVVALIRDRGLLRDFPDRTETDLYVWIAAHQAALESSLGWSVTADAAATDLAQQHSRRPERVLARVREQLVDALVPELVRAGPPPGRWRHRHLEHERPQRLFHSILVPLSGEAEGWRALEQAAVIAGRDGGSLYGLFVAPGELPPDRAAALEHMFAARCAAVGQTGKLLIDSGHVVSRICERARWADLVVVSVAHPPPPQPLARLRSGFRDLIQRCPQPLLAVPGEVSPLTRALVAYDGSPRADEALLLAAYLALRGAISLVVVTAVDHGRDEHRAAERAQRYLEERGITAGYVVDRAPAPQAILDAAEEHGSNLIMMGGYGTRPALKIVLGSTVDQVLRVSPLPVLVCR